MNITQNSLCKNNLNFANFNQDNTCISIGAREAFRIFNIQPKFSELYSQNLDGVAICEMLFCSSLVAIVGTGDDPAYSPRRLYIFNTKTQASICELNFVTPILAVKLNRKRIVVVMETKIHIYDISTMKILHTIDTVPNPKGLAAFSSNEDNCYLCYPGSSDRGEVVVFDALSLQTTNVIQAHKTPLAKLAINASGTLVATASNQGTVIRVFSLTETQYGSKKLFQLRRGSYPALLYSIAFSLDSMFLCCSSDTGTVHVFKLTEPLHANNGSSSSSTSSTHTSSANSQYRHHSNGYNGASSAKGMSAYLSFEVLNDMWETIPVRSFATIKLAANLPNLCAFGPNNTSLMIVTCEGAFYQFSMDPKVGGELKLISENTLLKHKKEDQVFIG